MNPHPNHHQKEQQPTTVEAPIPNTCPQTQAPETTRSNLDLVPSQSCCLLSLSSVWPKFRIRSEPRRAGRTERLFRTTYYSNIFLLKKLVVWVCAGVFERLGVCFLLRCSFPCVRRSPRWKHFESEFTKPMKFQRLHIFVYTQATRTCLILFSCLANCFIFVAVKLHRNLHGGDED